MYANDYKFDINPVLGELSDTKRLEELKGEVKCLIMDSLYGTKPGVTPSEAVARDELKSLLSTGDEDLIAVTCFSSHIARLTTLLSIAKKLKRQPVFMGRSLARYTTVAEGLDLIDLSGVEVLRFGKQVDGFMKRLHDPSKYLLICTGAQGEPKAVLSRLAKHVRSDDLVIFSCITIPVEPNISNRKKLEEFLEDEGAKVYKDVHVSGHASNGDHEQLLQLVKPEVLIPTHGMPKQLEGVKQLALKLGWSEDKVKIIKNHQKTLV